MLYLQFLNRKGVERERDERVLDFSREIKPKKIGTAAIDFLSNTYRGKMLLLTHPAAILMVVEVMRAMQNAPPYSWVNELCKDKLPSLFMTEIFPSQKPKAPNRR